MWKHWINRNAWLEIDKFTGRVQWCYHATKHDAAVTCRMNQYCEVGESYKSQFWEWLEVKGYAVHRIDKTFPGYQSDCYEVLVALIPF